MKVTFLNRNVVIMRCKNNEDLVKWMMKNDYDTIHNESVSSFMESYADRKKLFESISLDFSSIQTFVEGLIANKIIRVEN